MSRKMSDWAFVVASINHSLAFWGLEHISRVAHRLSNLFSNTKGEILFSVFRTRNLDQLLAPNILLKWISVGSALKFLLFLFLFLGSKGLNVTISDFSCGMFPLSGSKAMPLGSSTEVCLIRGGLCIMDTIFFLISAKQFSALLGPNKGGVGCIR